MFRIITVTMLFSISMNAMAAGWTVERVRGEVLLQTPAGWLQVQPGSDIEDGAHIKTGVGARADFVRGRDRFTLGADTVVEIRDAGAELMTSVVQSAGTVTVDVERRNVQHFSVQTPFLAAVVKGTRFTVVADSVGSHVEVDRGVVQVQDSSNDLVANIHPGQEAAVTVDAPLQIDGPGSADVYTSEGVLVSPIGNKQVEPGGVSTDSFGPGPENLPGGDNKGHGQGNSGGNGNSGNSGSSGNSGGNGNSGNNGNSGGNGNSGNNGNSGSNGNSGNNGNSGSNGNSGGNGNSGNNGNSGGNGNSGNNGNSGSSGNNGNNGNGRS